MKNIFWRFYIIRLSLRWCWIVNLGDLVWYQGKKYIVCNGVYSNSWRLNNLDNGDNGWVSRSDCKKVLTLSNIFGSFRSGYWFYMTNWFKIWMQSGIKSWMRGCDIWAKRDQ